MITLYSLCRSQAAHRGYSADAPMLADLDTLANAEVRRFVQEDGSVRSYRSRVRYIAALFPDQSIAQLAETIHGIIAPRDLTLSDVRMILEGRRLDDASRSTAEVPVVSIQEVGRVLSTGGTIQEASASSGVSIDTVRAIDDYLGIRQSVEDALMDAVMTGVREGWSVRKIADVAGVSKSRAHRYIQTCRKVLEELGE